MEQPPRIIASYPKSGRTWVRYMLHTYLRCLDGEYTAAVDGIDDRFRRYRISFEHFASDPNRWHFELNIPDVGSSKLDRCVMIRRNVFEVLTSYFYESRFRQPSFGFRSTPHEFLRHPKLGVLKLAMYSNAWAHVVAPNLSDELRLAYHEMRADCTASMRRLVAFLGLRLDEKALAFAVEAGGFDRMRNATRNAEHLTFSPRNVDDERTYKVRRSDPHECLELFAEADLDFIEATLDAALTSEAKAIFGDCLHRPARQHTEAVYAAGSGSSL